MSTLAPGTHLEGSSDPRTVEQNQTIAKIQSPDTSAIQPKYGGFLMTPDGKLTNDLSLLNVPEARRAEIQKILDAKTVVMMLNEEGVPVQYYPTGVAQPPTPKPAPTPVIIPPAYVPPQPVKVVDAGDIIHISKNQFKKKYVQDSMKPLDSDSFTFENVSVGFSVSVTIDQMATYTTDVTTFELQPKEKKEVKITYVIPEINNLPEGNVTIYPSIKYTTKALYVDSIPVPKPVVIIPQPEKPQPSIPPVPSIPDSPPTYVAPIAVPFGRWVLTKISDEKIATEKIEKFVADENGQLPRPDNNYVGGVYRTVYGVIKTTKTPPQYDYVLDGDARGAGQKPTAPSESEQITYSDTQVFENTLLYQRASDLLETNNIATQMNVSPPVATPSIATLDQSVPASSGGGTVIVDNTTNEQSVFYRKLSQLEFAQ